MGRHEKMNKLLVSFALEELSEAEANQVRTHLSQCEMCRREYNRLKTLLESTEHVGQLTTDENIFESARQNMLAAMKTNQQKPILSTPNTGRGLIWRIIMKSRITKLAAAAILMLAGVVGFVVLFYNGAKPAYAVEQTIEAMRKIKTIHFFGIDWSGRKMECWIKVNPETGENDCHYLDEPERGQISVSTPEITYFYDVQRNVVRILHAQGIRSDIRFGRFIEDVEEKVVKDGKGSIEITKEYDQDKGKEVLILWIYSDEEDFKVIIDPETRLPFAIYFLRCAGPTQVLKDATEIYYDEVLPEGIFEFKIPEGAEVIVDTSDYKSGDPEKGLVIDGLSDKEGCILISEKINRAIMDHDLVTIRTLYPMTEGLTDQEFEDKIGGDNAIVELPIVGQIRQDGDIWQISYSFKKVSGKTGEVVWIIKYREINGVRSCVIIGQK